MKLRALIFAALAGAAGPALAVCPPLATDLQFDLPARQGADCAFDGAAENDVAGFYRGRAAVDLGHGQVGQRLMSVRESCGGYIERLLVLDCNAGDALVLVGLPWPANSEAPAPMIGPTPDHLVENIQPPKGPIALGLGTSLSQLRTLAEQRGIGQLRSLDGLFIGTRARNRFDSWCGCKRFYPNSAGARK